ncbi:hypothetical protein GCM10012275_61430 [Longimycelium tulufanense]|uniref:Uncharacterized protein n=1 Tax=Longimycelium tulufanense TaxID=907463 RepID=A0A8J3FYJ2_9PSEU|nr:hypothetical protein GCM10012275_61430 [Longimycelium tulufanense]
MVGLWCQVAPLTRLVARGEVDGEIPGAPVPQPRLFASSLETCRGVRGAASAPAFSCLAAGLPLSAGTVGVCRGGPPARSMHTALWFSGDFEGRVYGVGDFGAVWVGVGFAAVG